jgi:hypothetical protein
MSDTLNTLPLFRKYKLSSFGANGYTEHNINFSIAKSLLQMKQEAMCLPMQLYICKGKGKKTKLRGLSPRANYTDRAAAAGRRS